MNKFVGRYEELEILNEKFSSNKSELFILYGRRRVGKTTLIQKSIEKRDAFYYIFSKSSYKQELESFRKTISEDLNTYFQETNNFYDLFEQIVKQNPNLIIVLDEFTYLIETKKEITGEFQKIWDVLLKNTQIKLILSGSSISIMEQNVLSYNSPLFGRRTGQLKLKEFKFNELKEFFPKVKKEELFKIYSTYGGIPLYLELYDQNSSYLDNIKATFCNKSSILYEEADFLLREELREPEIYFKILEQINLGATKLNEIATKANVLPNNIHKYLHRLELLEIIKREEPITIENKKLGLYKIQDKFFRFWLTFIYPNQRYIELKKLDFISEELKKISLPFSKTFEEEAIHFIYSNLKFTIEKIGSWWYKHEEIDILGISQRDKNILFGECKYESKKMEFDVFEILLLKKDKVLWNINKRSEEFVLISKAGFTKKIIEEANKRDNLHLFTLENFF